MTRFYRYRWLGILVMFALIFAVVPVQARPTIVPPAVQLSADAAAWLKQAAPDATGTFLVGLQADGTEAQVAQAAALSDRFSQRVEVHRLLRSRAGRNDAALRAFLRSQGLAAEARSVQSFATFNGFSITAGPALIKALQNWDQVSSIELDTPIQLEQPTLGQDLPQINAVEWNITKIGADRVQSELGINGTGVVVGNLDSGVRSTHEALSANYKCAGGSNTNCWFDAISGQSAPYDDNGHGTHTMGTAVGSGGIGVAPGVQWIACKAFSASGSGSRTDILECFDWFLAPGGNAANAPDVVNNSWGNSNGSNTVYQQAITNLINAGIYLVFSNGNSGSSCGTVGAPASYTNVLGVGATNSTDTIASFSSRGPSPFGGTVKPGVSAPGVSVRSAYSSGNTAYTSLNGTSMAAPHVSGLVALLLDANPALSLSQITANLTGNTLQIAATGCSSSGVPNNIYGWGRIRAYESVQAALGSSTPIGPAAPSNLTATAASRMQVNLAWSDNSSNENGFKIERCSGNNCTNFVEIAQVGANVTSYSNTGLNRFTVYRYRVRAFNADGNSGYSNVATVRTSR